MPVFSISSAKFLVLDGIGGIPLGQEIAENLQANGHSAIHFDCLKQRCRKFYGIRSACAKFINKRAEKDGFYLLPRLVRQTLESLVRQEKPTHILVIGFIYKFFEPMELRRIADTCRASLLLYDTDSCNLYDKRREFIFFIEHELPIYDRIFSFSQVTARFFQETRGLPAVYLPFGAQPINLPAASNESHDVLFVGSGDLRRILLLERIRDHVSVFGNRWARNTALMSASLRNRVQDRPVWGSELHQLFADAKIVLNITRSPFYGAETGINLRIFEALAAGVFLLTDHCDEIGDLFTPGVELDTFRGSSELAEKVDWYLANPAARTEIAQRGHQRFIAEFCWEKRCAELLRMLGYEGAQ
jgi:spore maturation protein CgeB